MKESIYILFIKTMPNEHQNNEDGKEKEEKLDASSSYAMQEESSGENSDSPRMRKLTVNSKPVQREAEAGE